MSCIIIIKSLIVNEIYDRSVAQLVERRSPKPKVGGSSPFAPATIYLEDVEV